MTTHNQYFPLTPQTPETELAAMQKMVDFYQSRIAEYESKMARIRLDNPYIGLKVKWMDIPEEEFQARMTA